jgi:hypothetical protein
MTSTGPPLLAKQPNRVPAQRGKKGITNAIYRGAAHCIGAVTARPASPAGGVPDAGPRQAAAFNIFGTLALLVIIGTMPPSEEHVTARSFEIYRNARRGLEIVTSDELLSRGRLLLQALAARGVRTPTWGGTPATTRRHSASAGPRVVARRDGVLTAYLTVQAAHEKLTTAILSEHLSSTVDTVGLRRQHGACPAGTWLDDLRLAVFPTLNNPLVGATHSSSRYSLLGSRAETPYNRTCCCRTTMRRPSARPCAHAVRWGSVIVFSKARRQAAWRATFTSSTGFPALVLPS